MAGMPTQKLDLPLCATAENCQGRTFIVTGANCGLGLEAAKHLVDKGSSKVIMACRNVTQGEEAKASIESETGKTGVAELWPLDLSSYDSVRAFAKRAAAELDRVDAVIENAGTAMMKPSLAEGHQMIVTVNILSTFLLGLLMLPQLKETAKKFPEVTPHLTIVGSRSGLMGGPEEWNVIKDDPLVQLDNVENKVPTYPATKIVDILVAKHLASLIPLEQAGVVVNVLCPGICSTNLDRNAPPEFRAKLANIRAAVGRTAEQGSRTLLHGAFAGKESHGHFLDSCEIADDLLPEWLKGEEGEKCETRSWDVVSAELEKVEPGCLQAALKVWIDSEQQDIMLI